MGTLSIACAAVDDITGWCILAYIVVLVRAKKAAMPAWITIGGAVAYVLVMLLGVRRLLPPFEQAFRKEGRLTEGMISLMIALALASGLATEWLGIHLLFGAFLMGAIMFSHSLHHHGVDGAGHYVYDLAAAGMGLPY
jgi:Kef-type K+ transport system membrane component KefB